MRRPFVPHPMLKGVFAGAGSDGLSEPFICNEVLRLTGKLESPKEVTVAYLGTATYDLEGPMKRQTGLFASLGCTVVPCNVALNEKMMPQTELQSVIADKADIVIVSGGNTLYAMDRWKMHGVDIMLRAAMERGCVLAGGSAGAICWFDAGHSDSMDPDTFRDAMLASAAKAAASSAPAKDEASAAPTSEADKKDWPYIRVGCLGFIPGLVCPHHDKVQSNGVLRATDFDGMVRRHATETAICIDHWAALVVEGEGKYKVVGVPGKEGSVILPEKKWTADRTKGVPGVWLKRVVQISPIAGKSLEEMGIDKGGAVTMEFVDFEGGELSSLVAQYCDTIVVDPKEEECRGMNPAA